MSCVIWAGAGTQLKYVFFMTACDSVLRMDAMEHVPGKHGNAAIFYYSDVFYLCSRVNFLFIWYLYTQLHQNSMMNSQ